MYKLQYIVNYIVLYIFNLYFLDLHYFFAHDSFKKIRLYLKYLCLNIFCELFENFLKVAR